MPERIETINTLIALEARDLLPETWSALANADSFGQAALQRRHNRVLQRIFGSILNDEEQEALELVDSRIIEFAGKSLAYALLDPAIEYWSKQAISFSISERESKSYKDRAADLKEYKKSWLADLAVLQAELENLLPVRGVLRDIPHVANIGDNILHVTPDPLAIPPAYGAEEL